MSEQENLPPRISLQPRRWYAMELWNDDASAVPFHSPSPIRVESVRPLKTGRNEMVLEFFHAAYPEGVQGKCYRLSVLFRARYFMLAAVLDDPSNQALWIGEMSLEWLLVCFDDWLAGVMESHADAVASADAQTLLDRCFPLAPGTNDLRDSREKAAND